MLAVALGGVFVEVLKDSALAPLPVSPGQARTHAGPAPAAAPCSTASAGAAARRPSTRSPP